MRNVEVVSAFLDKKVEGVVPISSDGAALYSYGVPIAIWKKNGTIAMPESSKFYSRTTSRHRHMIEDMAMQKGIGILKIG